MANVVEQFTASKVQTLASTPPSIVSHTRIDTPNATPALMIPHTLRSAACRYYAMRVAPPPQRAYKDPTRVIPIKSSTADIQKQLLKVCLRSLGSCYECRQWPCRKRKREGRGTVDA